MESNDILSYLWTSELQNLQIDLANHRITFESVRRNDASYSYSVVIEGVMGFAWLDGYLNNAGHFNTESMNYIDLTSAFTDEDEHQVKVVRGQFFTDYGCTPNLFFEISNGASALMVEAKSIRINEHHFVLKSVD